MMAVVKAAPGPGAELRRVPIPSPGPTDVLIRVRTAAICGTDLHIYNWDSWSQQRIRPPLVFGHEFCGVVERVGAAVTMLRPGDFVSAEMHVACGRCYRCRTGSSHICRHVKIIGVDSDGCLAEFVRAPEANVWKVDAAIPSDVAAVFDPLGNAVHTVLAGPVAAATIAVIGCGPIGQFAVAVARACGASRIFAVEIHGRRIFQTWYQMEALLQSGRLDITPAITDRLPPAEFEKGMELLRQAAARAIEKYGIGSGAVRTIAGTMAIHMALEEKIAAFKNVAACVVFQSGFAANAGTVAAILGKDDTIISDELNHASIIDGCRLSRAGIRIFPHRDAVAAEAALGETPGRKLLISDGVFSMDGDIAPLPALVEAAEKHGAIMMVDDAHASGVLGRNGRGTIDHFGVHGRVHVQVGTLSKAIGALGGYVCGSRHLIEFLYHRARPFLFSTSHPPSVAATCLAAFEVLEQEPGLIEQLWENTRFFKKGLAALGFDTGASETPITPVMVGDAALAFRFPKELFDAGVFATGIGYPTVPRGKARIRTIVTATHTRAELEQALGVLEKVGRKLKIVG